ncbi:MAG: hypothetical protein FJX59_15530, partial [Alphaproteobacteria bacterium]|nr:hypothetical protein [Alphaproteobacteria bacterium]
MKTLAAVVALSLGFAATPAFAQNNAAPAAGAAKSLNELLERVRQGRAEDNSVNKQREDEFRRAVAQQQQLLANAKAQVAAAEAEGGRL